MSNTFIISDTHFNHSNILEFQKNRQFDSVEEMNEKMIDAWNSVVKKNDTVIHLGDFNFAGLHNWIEMLDRLKGNITLLKGNHDKTKIIKRCINEGLIHEYHEIGFMKKIDSQILHFSHYPLITGIRRNYWGINGHVHDQEENLLLNNINVGVDGSLYAKSNISNFGEPLSFEVVMDEVRSRKPLLDEMVDSIKLNRKSIDN